MNNNWALPLRKVPSNTSKDSSIVWNTVHLGYEQKLFGQVTSLRYNNTGTILGGTSTNQLVLLRVPQGDGVVVNEQTERKNYSISFRDDDKLYIQSVDQRVVIKSTETAFERQYLGHTRDVRSSIFLGRHNFVSGSDDTTLKLWDLLSEEDLGTAQAHTDYVRCLEAYTSGTFFSGSYDHVVHLWDPRVGLDSSIQSSGSVFTRAVETMCYVPDLAVVAVGSGDQIFLCDPRKGLSTPLFQGSFHTKPVVALAYSSPYQTLLSGSLDGRLKMFSFEGEELRCICRKQFGSGVTSLAVHPQSKEYAVGGATGDVNIYKFSSAAENSNAVSSDLVLEAPKPKSKEEVLRAKLDSVEFCLSRYQYGKAMKTALYSRHPDVLVSTVEELVRRGALHVALNNQNDRMVVRMLRFATEYVEKPYFTDVMLAVFETIFEIYSSSVQKSIFLHREIMISQKRIGAYLAAMQRMEKTTGVMELIINTK